MGFFDHFSSKKQGPDPSPRTVPEASVPPPPTSGGVKSNLMVARKKLEAKDLAGASAIYEEMLATAGERADVLVTISGDLGSQGHITQIIELIAPRYDADRHGPATGLNLLQAYIAVRNADAAQHVLDLLFALNRPELEERLHGFSNVIADMMLDVSPAALGVPDGGAQPEAPKLSMISISKPIWFYGLEPLAERILPTKSGRSRTLAFCHLAVPGSPAGGEKSPGDELNRLALAIPLWLTETFSFAAQYAAVTAVGLMNRPDGPSAPAIFEAELTTENLRQLVDSVEGGVDYAFTGALRQQSGDYELVLRVWEVRKFRERKMFQVRWTPATADAELAKLHDQLRTFMEWSPASAQFVFTPSARPRAWLDTLDVSLGLFLAEKKLLPVDPATIPAEAVAQAAEQAAGSEMASLAYLTLQARMARLGLARPADVALAASPLVAEAQGVLR